MNHALNTGRHAAAGLALFFLCGPLLASTLFRCNVDGRTTYSDQTCSGQPVAALRGDASPSAQQLRAGQQRAQNEQALAAQWRAERLSRERSSTAATSAAGIVASAPGLTAADRLAPAQSHALANQLGTKEGKGKRKLAQKDPRVTFEVKLPAPKRKAKLKSSS
jgi:hypothetical protein